MCKHDIDARSRKHYCRGNAESVAQNMLHDISYSECLFVVLGIQHANHIRRIILSAMASLVVPNFSTLSHKRHT
jgi:hypothetical protein